MGVAAEFPDIDTLWGLKGPVASFEHHRGITHTFVGLPFEAALIVLVLYLVHSWRQRRLAIPGKRLLRDDRKAPARWGSLYWFTLVALLSHILLDFTNNYGVRPFFPFNPRWYSGSIVFIFDPLIFLLLLTGLLMPWIFGLVGQEIAGRRQAFRGAGWPRAALVAIVVLWCFRGYEHNLALALANQQTMRAPAVPEVDADPQSSDPASPAPRPLLLASGSLASPDPLSPFRWYVATDYGRSYQLGTVDTQRGAFSPDRVLNKPDPNPMIRVAEGSQLGRVYLDWSPMPSITASSDRLPSSGSAFSSGTTVTFSDVRFLNGPAFLQGQRMPPLTGQVLVDPHGQVAAEGLGGRFEK